MNYGFDFSAAQLLTNLVISVVVPLAVAAGLVATIQASEPTAPRGRLGMWSTGAVALLFGCLACAGWLSWTAADHSGEFRGPGLPAPTSFPSWQIVACGATMNLACLLAAHWSRKTIAGGVAAAAGTAGGFTAAFCVAVAREVTSQGAVGLVLSILGWGLGLTVLMVLRAVILTELRRRGGTSRAA